MSQTSHKTITQFDSLCKFISFEKKENNSVAMVAYHSENVMEELLIDLGKKFTNSNIVQINLTPNFSNLAQATDTIKQTSNQEPNILILKGREGDSIDFLEQLSSQCYYTILLFLPPKEMALFLHKHGAYFTTKPYFKF